MAEDSHAIQFQIGQLTGQVTALIATVNAMSTTMNALESRLRENERDTTKLNVKMAVLGMASGALGSFGMSFLMRWVG